ncbi:hydrogen peroxide-inducible genes activator [Persicimonas caeni]|uniref:Hydrogen peroxide-inducible genes activator n=1 Tax=Persicimonas caeni TaxID=2292766 RepID=A0A4Y6Q0G9_PERCE|nr:hydrogen peroxide-inducible genes activator [Persicimonas caeni]QDG53939.1 hydrogen peroxide-inducible genes activator [Persicimonas caeni]QED35160.1 hydrogen peroxide-inducible genes activator [Persicimonas caeni]
MTPTLRQLEYIVALADTGQFIEAAKQCAVSQPALSKQVREVEDMLGVELFERARPRVLMTPAGEEIVRRARLMLAEARELVSAASAYAGKPHGLVRLGVIPTIAPYGLPGLLATLRRIYPEVSFAIHELQTDVLLDELRGGAIDLGLLARPFDNAGLSGPDLIVEPFVFVAPTDHPLSTPESIETCDVAGASLILMEDGHCLRDQAIEVCAAAGPPPATSVTAASVATLVRMVESGLGATLLPASALSTELRSGQGLVARSFGDSPPGRTLTLQWRSTSPSEAWFLDIADVLRDHYLELNATIPDVAGPKPQMRAVDWDEPQS